jgi:hypothetical protein
MAIGKRLKHPSYHLMIYKQHSTLAYTKLDPPGAVNFNRWTPSSGLQFQPPLAPPPQSGWWLATQQDLKAPKWQLMGYIFLMGIHIYIYDGVYGGR